MNIYDLAKETGLSIATISRVLNGGSGVSEKTKNAVEAAMNKHHYMPNEIARSLASNTTRTVGVMTIDIRDIYYANVTYTVVKELSKAGYNAILSNTGKSAEEKIAHMNALARKKVDGLILVGSVFRDEKLDSQIGRIAKRMPVVMVNSFADFENVFSVLCDDRLGLIQAVDHLVAKGRKKLIYLRDTDTYSAICKSEGFAAGIEKHKDEGIEGDIIEIVPSLEGGYAGISSLLQEKRSFDGVLCGDDLIAIGACKCLKQQGIRIPAEVSVVGFNGSILSDCCDPTLTTVDSRMSELGMQAVDLLLHVLKGEAAEKKNLLAPILLFKEST